MKRHHLTYGLFILLFTSVCSAVQFKVHGLEHFSADANFEISYTLYTYCNHTGAQYQCSEDKSHGFVPVKNLEPLLAVIGRRADVFEHNHAIPYQDSTITLQLANASNACRIVLTQKQSVDIHFHPNGSCDITP